MRRIILLSTALLLALASWAQKQPVDKINLGKRSKQRAELILPQVNGYNIYKADLHNHTIDSDGQLTPKARVAEAYYDGMDIIAITDHLEFRPNEEKFLEATAGYHKKKVEAANHLIHREPADKRGILTDLNIPWCEGVKYGKRYGVMVIPGVEISRHPDSVGHYNALFIKDVNKIYHPDAEQIFRKAKAQGALIMHNHPVWRRSTSEKNEFQQKVYAAGLIDGVEVVNGFQFAPKMIKRCLDEKLFIGGGTDSHGATSAGYTLRGYFRTCTLIFAKECTEEAIKEALQERRTLAYSAGNIIGDQPLLKELFGASVRVSIIATDAKGVRTLSLTNLSSVEYELRRGKSTITLAPFQTTTVTVAPKKNLAFSIMNMWCSTEKSPHGTHPYYKIMLDELAQ